MAEIKTQFKKVKIKKIDEVRYHGCHPNDINVGFELEGEALNDIVEGECLYIGSFRTSRILEVVSYNIFRTKNSIYEIEVAA